MFLRRVVRGANPRWKKFGACSLAHKFCVKKSSPYWTFYRLITQVDNEPLDIASITPVDERSAAVCPTLLKKVDV